MLDNCYLVLKALGPCGHLTLNLKFLPKGPGFARPSFYPGPLRGPGLLRFQLEEVIYFVGGSEAAP